MASRLSDRLSAARQRRLFGRAAEREVFAAALASDELPFCVLHVFGPGGVGKTTLLGEYATECARAGVRVGRIDGRDVDPVPATFLAALTSALDLSPQSTPIDALAARGGRAVILVDTYETMAPLDDWLRDTFLPQLPDDILVVLAGRQPPSLAWRVDPGWRDLVHTLPLRNLAPAASRAYLTDRHVPPAQHDLVLAFTHGHPLALSLVADVFDQRPDWHFQPEAAPDMVKALLERFVRRVPGPAHRAALEACALVRLTTEALLCAMLGLADAHDLFEWLRGLSFIEAGVLGLFPHDLAREALVADLRWRNPDWYAELHHRARGYFAGRLKATQGYAQQRVLFDYIFLHRDNPIMRPFLEWQETGNALPDALTEGDRAPLIAMVAEYEGHRSAELAAYWFTRQPGGVTIYRDETGVPRGFLAAIALHHTTADDRARDPAIAAAWHHLSRHAPLRPGEGATIFRFWMAHDGYQSIGPTQTLLFCNVAQHYLTTPGLAYSFFTCAEPDFWEPLFTHLDLHLARDVEFAVGTRRHGAFVHDWRVTPPVAWLDLLAEREIETTPRPHPASAPPTVVVLSEPEFAAAVRDALRDFVRPDGLRDNPLLRSRLVVERVGSQAADDERLAALRALVREATASLDNGPRDAKLYRAIHHTYLSPAPTQEAAAELLDLPFSTYRRHLAAGIARVAALLWARDIGASTGKPH